MKNLWEECGGDKFDKVMEFGEGYKKFLKNKTERMVVKRAEKMARGVGFKGIEEYENLKKGDRVYFNNRGKNLLLFVIGRDIREGMRILGSHIDSPRLDLKASPLYGDSGLAYFDTHYYGGIKKYQWVTIPLALYGVVCKGGEVIDIRIGEGDDPVLGITDLLPHLAADQMKKTGREIIDGEGLDALVGSIPIDGDGRANVINLLKGMGIDEGDFISSELQLVPAGRARDFGLDRSMIAGYGQDDRVCAYSSLRAILDIEDADITSCCFMVDKEEIGSYGATGAYSDFFKDCAYEVMQKAGKEDYLGFKKMLGRSKMISADVSAAYDPLYSSAYEKRNDAQFGMGMTFNKYTGSGGKYDANDANPEYIAWLRGVMDGAGVRYQVNEMGRIDQGGGGTIAHIFANMNMDVIDAGVAILNMHAPMEISSKIDVYESYLGYKAFLKY